MADETAARGRCAIICAAPECELDGLRADDYVIACDGGCAPRAAQTALSLRWRWATSTLIMASCRRMCRCCALRLKRTIPIQCWR